jgi:hypothetical protein
VNWATQINDILFVSSVAPFVASWLISPVR